MAVSIWDFGGQEYYHGAYRLFMSANAVYVVLWEKTTNRNGRRPTRLNQDDHEVDLEHFSLEYWLDTVRHYGKEHTSAPLLVAQNKTDCRKDKRRLPQALHELYGITESFHFSLQESSDTRNRWQHQRLSLFESELAAIIAKEADKSQLSSDWQRVRQEILKLQTDKSKLFEKKLRPDGSVSLADFETVCRKIFKDERVTAGIGKSLADVFDRGGVVKYFPNSNLLADRVFLKPAELAKRLYRVLNIQVKEKNGELSKEDLLASANPEKEQGFPEVFIDVAQQLELIFPHPTRNHWFLAPQYLPDSHPVEEVFRIAPRMSWQMSFWLKVPLFYYKKLLNRLMLDYARQTESPHYWKHGIIFIKDELRVLIKGLYPAEDETDGALLIAVETDPAGSRHLTLQKEIFDKCRELLRYRGDEHAGSLQSDTRREERSSMEEIIGGQPRPDLIETQGGAKTADKRDDQPDTLRLWISPDGEFYVRYADLLRAVSEEETHIEGKRFQHKIIQPIETEASNTNQEKEVPLKPERRRLPLQQFEALLDRRVHRAKRVFISYSHVNTWWLVRLQQHLAGLRRSNDVEDWTDREIFAGEEWDPTIRKKLQEADVFILLLSADFVSSEYIWNVELKTAFEKYKQDDKSVIPILVEPFDLGGLPGVAEDGKKIQNFEIVPKDQGGYLKALSLWKNSEEGLAVVAQRIREAITKK